MEAPDMFNQSRTNNTAPWARSLSLPPQWQQEVWQRQQNHLVDVISYLDDPHETESLREYYARLSATVRSQSPELSSPPGPEDEEQGLPVTAAMGVLTPRTRRNKKDKKDKKENEKGEGGEKARSRGKRRKQSFGEMTVSDESVTTESPRRARRGSEAVADSIIADRYQIQARAVARFNLLARAPTHSFAEREA